ncbi:hypothetical protein QQS21_000133 [Conoideocrella luteorostrata]|uniref:Uncharacterized protein n=1 Tax=Conoideocrella luteorostrata TaxID=1105319 RepID=A0AAJ0D238_9HYPO|nr:hypothetical protein QQS21_000133 [Conoideocrella luteorostrata]
MTIPPRYAPCFVLQKAQVLCVIWFEDALWHHGVPTCVFDLYLLVRDIDLAAEVLLNKGWKDAPPPTKFTFNFLDPHPEIARRRLDAPGANEINPPGEVSPEPATTVLLKAADFKFPAEKFAPTPASLEGYFPPLPVLTDALIDSLLDAPHDCRLQSYMALQLSYLYGYVCELKEQSFSKVIKYENRQFHHDALSGVSVGTLPIITIERQVRDELRKECRMEGRLSTSTTAPLRRVASIEAITRYSALKEAELVRKMPQY